MCKGHSSGSHSVGRESPPGLWIAEWVGGEAGKWGVGQADFLTRFLIQPGLL
jgi:hypothetical protein